MFGIFPKKLTPQSLKKTVAFWLSVLLLAQLIYNIILVSGFEKTNLLNKFDKIYSEIKFDELTQSEFKQLQIFESGQFCGWKFIEKSEQIFEKSSKGFSENNGLIISNIKDNKSLLVCLNKTDSMAKIIFSVVIYAILFFIIYPKFLKEIPKTTEKKDEEIPNS